MNTSPSDPPEEDDDLEACWKDVRVPGRVCVHPRAKWYADREYGTTFCGICHVDITSQLETLLACQEVSPVIVKKPSPRTIRRVPAGRAIAAPVGRLEYRQLEALRSHGRLHEEVRFSAPRVDLPTDPAQWLFAVSVQGPELFVVFTPITYWLETGAVIDRPVGGAIHGALPSYLHDEVMEATFLAEQSRAPLALTVETVTTDLVSWGFRQDPDFTRRVLSNA